MQCRRSCNRGRWRVESPGATAHHRTRSTRSFPRDHEPCRSLRNRYGRGCDISCGFSGELCRYCLLKCANQLSRTGKVFALAGSIQRRMGQTTDPVRFTAYTTERIAKEAINKTNEVCPADE